MSRVGLGWEVFSIQPTMVGLKKIQLKPFESGWTHGLDLKNKIKLSISTISTQIRVNSYPKKPKHSTKPTQTIL